MRNGIVHIQMPWMTIDWDCFWVFFSKPSRPNSSDTVLPCPTMGDRNTYVLHMCSGEQRNPDREAVEEEEEKNCCSVTFTFFIPQLIIYREQQLKSYSSPQQMTFLLLSEFLFIFFCVSRRSFFIWLVWCGSFLYTI